MSDRCEVCRHIQDQTGTPIPLYNVSSLIIHNDNDIDDNNDIDEEFNSNSYNTYISYGSGDITGKEIIDNFSLNGNKSFPLSFL